MRKSISKKLRFEVFKRDSFTCQYCGRHAPDVILQCDHIVPVASGGENDILNLVTSCRDCNSGKGATELGDHTVLQKRKQQLDAIQERREQLEMMFEWEKSLLELHTETINKMEEFWSTLTHGFTFTDKGRQIIQSWLKLYKLDEIMDAMVTSTSQYIKYATTNDGSGQEVTKDSVNKSFAMIPAICANRNLFEEKPYLKELYYIRGILRNRMTINEQECLDFLVRAYNSDIGIMDLQSSAKRLKSWNEYEQAITALIVEREQAS